MVVATISLLLYSFSLLQLSDRFTLSFSFSFSGNDDSNNIHHIRSASSSEADNPMALRLRALIEGEETNHTTQAMENTTNEFQVNKTNKNISHAPDDVLERLKPSRKKIRKFAWKVNALSISSRVSGSLSMLGSLILIIIVLSSKKKRSHVYHRIILGMSIIDLYSSFWYALGRYPIDKPKLCIAQGWSLQVGLATPIYNAMLAIFYLLVIRFKWNDAKIKKVEPIFHLIPVVFGIATATASISLQIIAPNVFWCIITNEHGTEHATKIAYR